MEILQEFGKSPPGYQAPGCHSLLFLFAGNGKEYIAMGYYIGIGGVVTFKNAKKLVETAKEIPLERILVETDSPYLCPEPNRGKRNDSSQIRYVIDKIAAIRGILPEEVEKADRDQCKKHVWSITIEIRVTMAYLGNPAYTMAVLEKHGFHFQKKYGQNFFDRYAYSGKDHRCGRDHKG